MPVHGFSHKIVNSVVKPQICNVFMLHADLDLNRQYYYHLYLLCVLAWFTSIGHHGSRIQKLRQKS